MHDRRGFLKGLLRFLREERAAWLVPLLLLLGALLLLAVLGVRAASPFLYDLT